MHPPAVEKIYFGLTILNKYPILNCKIDKVYQDAGNAGVCAYLEACARVG